MNRRRLLAATAGLAATTGCLDDGADEQDPGDERDEPDGPPFDIELIDAPGSEARTVPLPQSGQVALINFTRQNCPTSAGYLDTIGEAYDRLSTNYDVGPDAEIFVCSVIDWTVGATPSDDELADWWREQDGHWPIGIDRSGALFEEYHSLEFPGTAVIGDNGDAHWQYNGTASRREIVTQVEAAVDAERS